MIDRNRTVLLPIISKTLLPFLVCGFAAPAFSAEPITGPLAGTTAAHNQVRQNLNNGVVPAPTESTVQPVPSPALANFVWDDGVAATAQAWADLCVDDHDPDTPFGENIANRTAGFGLTGPDATANWVEDEADDYTYATNTSAGVTGHYTQVVWSTSVKLGCGFTDCGAINGWDWVVCRYDPGGNVNTLPSQGNRRPYCTATQTTECQSCDVPGGLWDQNLTTGLVSGAEQQHACVTITAGGTYGVGGTGNLTLRGRQSVRLNNGFSVLTGGMLIVSND